MQVPLSPTGHGGLQAASRLHLLFLKPGSLGEQGETLKTLVPTWMSHFPNGNGYPSPRERPLTDITVHMWPHDGS